MAVRVSGARKPGKQKNSEEIGRLVPAGTTAHIIDSIAGLVIKHRSISSLRPNPRNARTHSARQISQIEASIRRFGFLNPLLIDEDGTVLAGNGRLQAAKSLGLKTLPTIEASHLSAAEKRMMALADNRLAELSGWDESILKIELNELSFDLDLNLEVTGFDSADIDRLTTGDAAAKVDPVDELEPLQHPAAAVTRPGDVWLLGPHRLICGDSLDLATYRALLNRERADLVFSDPPFNVAIEGHVSGLGRNHHREFAMASGEMTSDEFTAFLYDAIASIIAYSRNGAIHFVVMDWRHSKELLDAALPQYGAYKNVCVWVKTNAGMGNFYRSQHEFCHVFKVGTAPHVNNFGLGEGGRYRTNAWHYAGANTFRAGRAEDLADHPTVKPIALVADAIRDCSHRGDIVLDAFGGSGTTLLAAERTGRKGRLIEIDPLYVDVTIRRWEKMTGKKVVLAATGENFDSVMTTRSAQPDSEREDGGGMAEPQHVSRKRVARKLGA